MASDDAYEMLLDGKPTGVVELPIERILDDSPYFGSNADGSNPSVGDVYEVFQSEFDVAYEEGGLYLLTMHPHMTGHRSRAAMLERLIQVHEEEAGRLVRDARTDRRARQAVDRKLIRRRLSAATSRASPTRAANDSGCDAAGAAGAPSRSHRQRAPSRPAALISRICALIRPFSAATAA